VFETGKLARVSVWGIEPKKPIGGGRIDSGLKKLTSRPPVPPIARLSCIAECIVTFFIRLRVFVILHNFAESNR
jgi:hypothetical protein